MHIPAKSHYSVQGAELEEEEEEEEVDADKYIIYVSFVGVITCMVFLGVTLFGHLTSKYVTRWYI